MRLIIFFFMCMGLSSCTTSPETSEGLVIQADQAVEVSEGHQLQKSDTQSRLYKWHDGTKGGLMAQRVAFMALAMIGALS